MVKEHIKGTSTFSHYKDSALWYITESGITFPVPIEDIGNATFLRTDKSLLFMRYIRKHLANIEASKNNS